MIEHFKSSIARWSLTIGALAMFVAGYLLVLWGMSANDPNNFDPIGGLVRIIFGLIACVTGSVMALVCVAAWTKALLERYQHGWS